MIAIVYFYMKVKSQWIEKIQMQKSTFPRAQSAESKYALSWSWHENYNFSWSPYLKSKYTRFIYHKNIGPRNLKFFQ